MNTRGSRKATATVALLGALMGLGAAQDSPTPGSDEPQFDGYDFSQVVETMETSVNPLQREMDRTFRVFVNSVHEAEELLDEGQTQEAVQMAAAAIESVLNVREEVLVPMWEGQRALAEQVARVRTRLAQAVEAAAESGLVKLDDQTEMTLNAVARRIADEQDPLRKKRLVAHYRTVRNIARIKAMSVELSPDQRKMWLSVTAANLRAYVSLMETVDGASQLMRIVRGVDEHSAGMSSFAASMNELQQRLSGFNESVEQALQGRMLDLEAQIDAIAPMSSDGATPVMAGDEDGELAARIARLGNVTQ
jgi:hypothetical protein